MILQRWRLSARKGYDTTGPTWCMAYESCGREGGAWHLAYTDGKALNIKRIALHAMLSSLRGQTVSSRKIHDRDVSQF